MPNISQWKGNILTLQISLLLSSLYSLIKLAAVRDYSTSHFIIRIIIYLSIVLIIAL